MEKEVSICTINNYMLQNAKDYIEKSVSYYHQEDFKYSLIFLWSGLLLFMKVRLFNENPLFIYASLDDFVEINANTRLPSYKKFDSTGNHKTVDFYEIKKRMMIIDPTSSIFKYKDQLNRIRLMRNRIEHFVNDYTENDYLSAMNAAFPFINDIIDNELELEATGFFDNWDEFISIKDLHDDRIRKMQAKLDVKEYHVHTDGDTNYFVNCPQCRTGKMIDNDYGELVCPICGNHSCFYICSRCGEVFIDDNWSQFNEDICMCDDCFDSICKNSD
jgi:hypothetical protein